jgi:hypothetical protein
MVNSKRCSNGLSVISFHETKCSLGIPVHYRIDSSSIKGLIDADSLMTKKGKSTF